MINFIPDNCIDYPACSGNGECLIWNVKIFSEDFGYNKCAECQSLDNEEGETYEKLV